MTTFHESQPPSRRAARQNERDESVEQAEFTGQPPEPPRVYSSAKDSGGVWSDVGTDAGEPGELAHKGRRAAAPAGPPALVSDPLAFAAAQTTPIPEYDGPSFVNRGSSPTRPEGDSLTTGSHGNESRADDVHGGQAFPPTQALSQVDRPAYRVRDFSPEGRRSASVVPAATAQEPVAEAAKAIAEESAGARESSPAPASVTPYVFPPEAPRPQFFVPESALADTVVPGTLRPESADRLDGSAVASREATVSPGVVAPLIGGGPSSENQPMTRRELRALEAERSTADQSPPVLPEFASDGSLTGAAAAVFVETDFDDDDGIDAGGGAVAMPARLPELIDPILGTAPAVSREAAPGSAVDVAVDDAAAVDEVPFIEPTLTPFDALFKVPPAEPRSAPAELAPVITATVATPVPPVEPLPIPTASKIEPLADNVVGFDPGVTGSVVDAASPAQSSAVAQAAWIAPLGHWSAQDDVDEDALGEGGISRTIGSGILTTNALVLPAVPEGTDIRGPLTGTGAVMLTGSIDLPLTLSSTGQTDRFDGESMDALFDLNDAEVISTDSSPVRAIRAVSTHTSGHGVTHTQKPKGTRALTGLLIAASSLAVAVAGLLVAAFAFNIF